LVEVYDFLHISLYTNSRFIHDPEHVHQPLFVTRDASCLHVPARKQSAFGYHPESVGRIPRNPLMLVVLYLTLRRPPPLVPLEWKFYCPVNEPCVTCALNSGLTFKCMLADRWSRHSELEDRLHLKLSRNVSLFGTLTGAGRH
jgi:hypothetical protein